MKLGMYIMPPEAISTAYFVNTNIAVSEIVEIILLECLK
jgi:hypothetical protein